jgi:hypothetical protein
MRIPAWALLIAMSGSALPPLLQAGDPGGRAQYVGGTVAVLPSQSEGHINLTEDEAFLFRSKQASVRIPYQSVNTIEYGQKVSRRYVSALLISPVLLLARKRRHFLTVGYTDDQGRQQAMVFAIGKRDIRAVLVGLEAKTGRRIEYQDEEARKAGKG